MSRQPKSPMHRLYCICGSKVEAQSSPPDAATFVVDWFLGLHNGRGHGLTTPGVARRNRAKAERIRNRAERLLSLPSPTHSEASKGA